MRTIKNRLTRLFRNQATARRSASRRRFQASIDVLETRQLLAADIAIVQDLNTDPASSLPSYAGNGEAERRFETIGDITYFVASTNGHGEELWKTDGTEEGTVLLKDVRAGNDSSSIRELTNLNGTLVFSAYDRIIGWELWKSDGTESGTVPVKDIKAGGSSSFPFNLYNWNGLLYFAADGGDGDELWVSNGSEAGTYQLKDIYSGSSNSDPADFVAVGNDLFFSARTSAAGRELWKTDGTSAGTELVKDINPGTAHSYPKELTSFNNELLFAADNGSDGEELWKSDGTDAGTVLVRNIRSGSGDSDPEELTVHNGTLYFVASGSEGEELWKSDGTEFGTVIVRDIRTTPSTSYSSSPADLISYGSYLYFSADDGIHGRELWRSNGIATYTTLVADIQPGSFGSDPEELTVVQNGFYFSAETTLQGRELWRSSGSGSNTLPARDIRSGTQGSNPVLLYDTGSELLFAANDGQSGIELWKSTGFGSATSLVKDINWGSSNADVRFLGELNGFAMFSAITDLGRELWRRDLASGEFELVRDIQPGSGSGVSSYAQHQNIAILNGKLYFPALTASEGEELWVTDGTFAGTKMVREINPGYSGSYPRDLTIVGNNVFFKADDGPNGNELWKTDGSDVGTVLVKDIRPGSGDGVGPYYLNDQEFTEFNGKLYFPANDGSNGFELWVSDGSSGGTVMVKDIYAGSSDSDPEDLTVANGSLFFNARSASEGENLWKSDGTAAGTTQVQAGAQWTSPGGLTNVNDTLYYYAIGNDAQDNSVGRELFKSDGTDSGTVLVKDINAGASSTNFRELTNVNGTLFFAAFEPVAGWEIWKSDGTEAGTLLVKDISPGTAHSFPDRLTNVNGRLYFRAPDSSVGRELWLSDGTEAGTESVTDAEGTRGYMDPSSAFAIGGEDFVVAKSQEFGQELFEIVSSADYGDAPSATMHSENGARHQTVGIRLGALRDSELDGNSSGDASGDDSSGGDDEDGVVISRLVKGDTASLTLDIQNAVTDGFADAWIDFNQDGDWNDPGEKVLHSELVSNGTVSFPVYIPTDAAVGETTARIRVSHEGDLLPTGLARSGEVEDYLVAVTHDVIETLPSGNGSDSFQILRAGDNLFVRNNATSNSTVYPLSTLNSLTIVGADNENDTLLINLQQGGFFGLPGGIHFDGGTGGVDVGSILPPTSARGTFSQTVPVSRYGEVTLNNAGITSRITISDVSQLTVGTVQKLDFAGDALLSGATFTLNANSPIRTDGFTSISSAQLNSNAVIALPAGNTVQGSGNVNARFAGELGSAIIATGNMNLGNANSYEGFATRGSLSTSFHTVTLQDANQAVLGSLTSLGNATTAGTISAANGLLVDFGNNVTGYGTLNTPNDPSKLVMINGSVVGTSGSKPITLPGYIKGVGSLDNVNITGTYSPGFSPAISYSGSITYGAGSTTILEIGGTTAGSSGHDQIIHSGTATLGGTLDIQLINGFTPVADDSFVLMTADTMSGDFSTTNLPSLPQGLTWEVELTATSLTARVVTNQQPPGSAPTITGPSDSTQSLRPTMTWTAVSGATEYEIWVKNQSTGENPYLNVTVSGTSYTPTVDLGIGRFNLWIRGKNAHGNGPWTSQHNFTVEARASMNDPGRFQSTHRPTLTWPALPGAAHYDLWINDKLGGVSQYIRDQNVNGTSWTPSSDMPLGLYQAWIRGIAADGTAGGWSVTTLFYVMPSPTVTAGMNPTFDRTPTFEWDALLGATHYELFIRDRNTGGTALYQQNIAGESFTVPTDLADGPYRAWVLGVSADNVRSFWTDPMDVYIGGRTDVLSPTGATGDSTPTFTWREVDGAVRYDLWVDQIGGQNQIIREQNLTSTSFTPGTSLADGSYRVWVRAISSTNETSDWSLTVTFSIVDSSLLPDDGEHGSPLAVLPESADDQETPDVPGEVTEFRIAESRRIVRNDASPKATVTPIVAPTSGSDVEVRRAATDAAFTDWTDELAAHV